MQAASKTILPHRARVDGCMAGLRDPANGHLIWKPWRIQTSSPEIANRMELRCTHGVRHERPEEGSAWAAFYPR
eukprot:7104468-Lingulodinium_polyedra.AAC.1